MWCVPYKSQWLHTSMLWHVPRYTLVPHLGSGSVPLISFMQVLSFWNLLQSNTGKLPWNRLVQAGHELWWDIRKPGNQCTYHPITSIHVSVFFFFLLICLETLITGHHAPRNMPTFPDMVYVKLTCTWTSRGGTHAGWSPFHRPSTLNVVHMISRIRLPIFLVHMFRNWGQGWPKYRTLPRRPAVRFATSTPPHTHKLGCGCSLA